MTRPGNNLPVRRPGFFSICSHGGHGNAPSPRQWSKAASIPLFSLPTHLLCWTGSAEVTGSPAVSFNVYSNSTRPVPIDAGHRVASGLTETDYTDCGKVYNRYWQFGTAKLRP